MRKPPEPNQDIRLESLLENLPGLAFRCRADRRWSMLFLSGQCETLTGYRPEALLDNHEIDFASLIHPRDRGLVRRHWRQLLSESTNHCEFEYRLITRDGRVRHVWQRGTLIRDRHGRGRYIEGLIEDITPRRHAESLLQEKHRVLQAVATGEPLGNILDSLARFEGPPDSDIRYLVLTASRPDSSRIDRVHARRLPRGVRNSLRCSTLDRICPIRAVTTINGENRTTTLDRGFRTICADSGTPVLSACEIQSPEGLRLGLVVMLNNRDEKREASPREQQALAMVTELAGVAIQHQNILHSMDLAADALDHAGEAVLILDKNLRIMAANQAFQRITGHPGISFLATPAEPPASMPVATKTCRKLLREVRDKARWDGEIAIIRSDGRTLPALCSIRLIQDRASHSRHYVAVFSDISRLRSYEKQIDYLAHYDPLTHLPNRTLIEYQAMESLRDATANDRFPGLLLIDLDHFKAVNDSLGTQAGDRVLLTVAHRLRAVLRDRDTVARLDSDHFLVLANRCRSVENLGLVASKLLNAISRPIRIKGRELSLSASIGIAAWPADGRDFTSLLSRAEAALNSARQKGRNSYRFFTGEMNRSAMEHLELATGLRRALTNGELFLKYQPVVDTKQGDVVGLETLIRWRHPELGLVMPQRFIALAEETGLIEPIGDWVLTTACAQLRQWREQGIGNLRLAINLSARQLWQADFVDRIKTEMQRNQIGPGMLELELTETMVMDEPARAREMLEKLAQLGVSIAIDDFGTGYSSLSHLQYFPFHRVKIDKSFIRHIPRDRDSATLVRTIIAMASTLRLELIAEGVETPAQHAFLIEAGCREAQGYYYSRAVLTEEVPDMLSRLQARQRA